MVDQTVYPCADDRFLAEPNDKGCFTVTIEQRNQQHLEGGSMITGTY